MRQTIFKVQQQRTQDLNECGKIRVFEDKVLKRDREHQTIVELNSRTITKHELLRQITRKVHGIDREDTPTNPSDFP